MSQQEYVFKLPELDRERTQREIEKCFERYRFYNLFEFEEREASITPGYNERAHGPTNVTSDQTAQIATYNVGGIEQRKDFCERVERAVKRLTARERILITERYLKGEYKYDWMVYQQVFNPPISKDTYTRLRWKAFYKLAFIMDDLRLIRIQSLVVETD